jgi:acetate kinase
LRLDSDRNDAGTGRISSDDSTLRAWVIPTDEAARMADEALACLGRTG